MAQTHDRIISDPAIMMGKPTIRGTRVTVELLLRKLGDGMVVGDLLKAYPHVSEEDVRAAQRFAADYLANEEILFGDPRAA